jgi:hypothetical protein
MRIIRRMPPPARRRSALKNHSSGPIGPFPLQSTTPESCRATAAPCDGHPLAPYTTGPLKNHPEILGQTIDNALYKHYTFAINSRSASRECPNG